MSEWTDQLAGARMQVDQQFRDRVIDSQFSNQQWGLIMTAVEWEVHDADDPESARLVADTSNLSEIVPELDRISKQMGGPAGPVDEGGGTGIAGQLRGFLDDLTRNSGGGGEAQLREAERLVQEYAVELQTFLEQRERWDTIRTAAAEQRST